MRAGDIDFVMVERLVQAESKRKEALLKRKSAKLLWFVLVGLAMTFIFL